MSSQPFDGHNWRFEKGTITLDGRHALAYSRIRHTTNPRDSDITRTQRQQRVMTALGHQLVSPWNIFNLPSIGRAIAKPLATDLTANQLPRARAGSSSGPAARCSATSAARPQVIGGQDVLVSSPQNAAVLGMFLGKQAPQHTAQGSLYGPGCSIH